MRLSRIIALLIFVFFHFHASALSVKEFDNQTPDQQADDLIKAVNKIVADVATVNPSLSQTIYRYYSVTPPGQSRPLGMDAFGTSFTAVRILAFERKLDTNKAQIEGILLDIIKTEIMAHQPANQNSLPPPARSDRDQVSGVNLKNAWKAELAIALDAWEMWLDKEERELRQKQAEADCRTIRLHDGRRVLVEDRAEERQYIDAATNQVLQGTDAVEARQNEIDLSDPATLQRYRQCLAEHGASAWDITRRKP